MSREVVEIAKGVLVYLIVRIKAFWELVRNPVGTLMKTKPRDTRPDILRNPIYGRHEFVQLPGVRLHYVESGQRDRELLLLVHGFPDFWFSWKSQLQEFSKDYWVVALDLRGYGESEKKKKVSFYKLSFLVNDIRNFVLKLGREKFSLVAHDWGGVISHYFIRLHPEMLNKYVLMNTVFHPKLGDTHLNDVKQLLKSWYILILQIPYYAEYFFLTGDCKKIEDLFRNFLTEEEMEAYKFTFGSYGKIRPPISYYRANFRHWIKEGIPTAGKLNELKIPGLYIHGENDFALTLNIAYKKSFEGVENVELVSVPDAGHFVHLHSPQKVVSVDELLTNAEVEDKRVKKSQEQ